MKTTDFSVTKRGILIIDKDGEITASGYEIESLDYSDAMLAILKQAQETIEEKLREFTDLKK